MQGGEKIDIKKKLLIISIIFILINISVISANEITSDNVTISQTDDLNYTTVLESSDDQENPDIPDLVDKNYTYVYQTNVGSFFPNGILDNKYEGKNLIISGNFENVGQLRIDCDNVFITGEDSNLKNTVFGLNGNNITLKNLKFNLDTPIKNNKGSAILVRGDDINLVNLDIDYIVPNDVEAYAILAGDNTYVENLKIINSTIYFEGHNDNVNKYNCAVKLKEAYDSIMENNTIKTSLPLKNIIYSSGDAVLDSNYVYTVGIERCHGFVFNNNTLIADVNKRTAAEYPTQVGFMISKSDEVVVSNNSIYMTDFVTYPGVENYLYGIDIHNLNNLLLINNSVSIVTTGGKLALGTAYPIQISGPINGVNITKNDLYSFSNGPNIGIYSQNFFGESSLSVTYNRINVTGLAGTDEWALVTGVESQDTYAYISNNIIEVHSVGEVNKDDNLFAISYRQSTDNGHEYNIENNIAFTDGFYSVYLLSSDHSNILNNTLVSYNDKANTGDDAYHAGPRQHNGGYDENNKVIRAFDYFITRNHIDNGAEIIIPGSSSSNNIDTNDIASRSQDNSNTNNPLIPGFKDLSGISQESGEISNGFIDDGSTQGEIGENSYYNQNSNAGNININSQEDNVGESNVNVSDAYGGNLDIVSNSSSSSPSAVGITPLGGSQGSSAGGLQSASKKAYEIDVKHVQEKFIPSLFIVIFVIILLIIGYRRKRNEENVI